MSTIRWMVASVALLAVACGDDGRTGTSPGIDGGGGPGADSGAPTGDPRCVALCTDDAAPTDDYCSPTSVSQCSSLCETRIAGVSNLCAECLLEDSDFLYSNVIALPDECVSDSSCASGQRCDRRGCEYCEGDSAAWASCRESTREAVRCTTDFQDVSECADLCS
ncbi:MAG: hypothetical protein JJ863_30905 [Deltaproteobacteria bacterium]|nr:hypothetical protein [Deltaproteobacteria bacterium]